MKIILPLLLAFSISLGLKAQQNVSNGFLSNNFSTKTSKDLSSFGQVKKKLNNIPDSIKSFIDSLLKRKKESINLPWFGIAGAGNLNEETFKTTNSSLKATLYARPLQYRNKALTIYASYNVNASNNDSILFSTLLFPEVGKNSFLGTIDWRTYYSRNSDSTKKRWHTLGPFLEFSHKNIQTDSSEDGQKLYFSTLNYTAGLKYTFNFWKKRADSSSNDTELSFSTTAYLSYLNIPDEDLKDYQAILARGQKGTKPEDIKENIFSWGVKIEFQVNSFGLFADFRSLIGGDKKFPLRELKGFHSNIGVTINTDFIHFK